MGKEWAIFKSDRITFFGFKKGEAEGIFYQGTMKKVKNNTKDPDI